jgi:hypothetical protein
MGLRKRTKRKPIGTSCVASRNSARSHGKTHTPIAARRITLAVTRRASRTRIAHIRRVYMRRRRPWRSRAMVYSSET